MAKKITDFIYNELENSAETLNKKDEEAQKWIDYLFYGTNYWRLAFYSAILGLTVTLTIIQASTVKKFPFNDIVGKAILYGLGGFILIFLAFILGKILASTNKLDFEKKKVIVVLLFIVIILVFLLPFIMVYIFGLK